MTDSIARRTVFASYQAAFYSMLIVRRTYAALRPEHAWRTWIDPNILVGGFLIPSDVPKLQRQGISAIVNASLELIEPVETINAASMAYMQVPCWDMRAPSFEDVDRALEFIAERVESGRRVYVHCASGAGRSVALVVCHLALNDGVSPRQAFDHIKMRRPRASLSKAQWEFVTTYVDARRK